MNEPDLLQLFHKTDKTLPAGMLSSLPAMFIRETLHKMILLMHSS